MSAPLSQQHHRWRWRVLIATYFGYVGYYLTRKLFGICKKPIADSLGWELADTAHLWTAFLLAYMLGQFLNGWLGRKWGPRILLLGGLGCSILVNAAFGFVNRFETFMAFMFLNGLFQASGWPGVVGGISAWLRPSERGRVMGIWSTSYSVGNLLVKYLGALTLAYLGWRTSFWFFSCLAVLSWFLLSLWHRDRPEQVGLSPIVEAGAHTESGPPPTYLHLLTHPLVLTMGLSYLCLKFLRYTCDSWLPAFLAVRFDISPSEAAGYSGFFDTAGLLGAACSGWLLDRVFRGNWAHLSLCMALGMVLTFAGILWAGTSPMRVALGFAAIGFLLYGPDMILSGIAAMEVGGKTHSVAVAGIVNGMGSLGPIIQEEVVGALLRRNQQAGVASYDYLTLSVSVVFAGLMLILALRPRPR
jgi:sugar phosphate permease